MKHRSTPRVAAALALAATLSAAPMPAAWAQAPAAAPLTLQAATDLALRANPALRAAASELAAAEGALAQAGALPNPELALLREDEPGGHTMTATLGIPIELGGKRAARVEAARQERALADIVLSAGRERLRADVAAAFHEVAAAEARERMARELADLAARALDAADKRVDAGTLSPLEQTRARVAQGGARIEALQAARDAQAARIRLAALWAGDARDLHLAAPEHPSLPAAPPLAHLLARLDGAPALRQARAQLAQREALARLEQARRMPDLSLLVGTQRAGPDARDRAVVGVSVPLPLFSRNEGAVLAALRRVDGARELAAAESARLRAELAELHARLTAAIDESTLLATEILPGAREAQRAATRGFELGKFGIHEVLDAQRVLAQSHNQYLQAVAGSHRAAADIARLLGSAAVQENP